MKTRFVRIAALSFSLAVLNSCNSIVEPDQQLRDAQIRWNQHGPSSYTMTVRRGCGECLALANGAVIIRVINGAVVSRTYEATGLPVPDTFASAFPSVDEIFDLILEVLDGDPYRAEAEYDAELGYPKSFSVDLDKQAVDDEYFILVSDFKPTQ